MLDISQKSPSENEIKYTAISPTNAFENPNDSTIFYRSYSSNYNSNNGYGLVNAGLAVSKAAGNSPYEDVPILGGNNWGADMIKSPTVGNKG
ncbi:MAG: hypothetical protein ACKPGB_26505 [Dolichospermum sp.]